jgi:hypothetical protein
MCGHLLSLLKQYAMLHGVQDKLHKVMWPKYDSFSEITHLAVIAFKEGNFQFCWQLKFWKMDCSGKFLEHDKCAVHYGIEQTFPAPLKNVKKSNFNNNNNNKIKSRMLLY